jgi:hypothetical protein
MPVGAKAITSIVMLSVRVNLTHNNMSSVAQPEIAHKHKEEHRNCRKGNTNTHTCAK